MGIGDSSAFPPHLDEKHERDAAFKDDNESWFLRWRKLIKPWFVFGPRSPNGIAFSPFPPWILARKWRAVPKLLWAKKEGGYWRFEANKKPDLWSEADDPFPFLKDHPDYYLSRCQHWARKAMDKDGDGKIG